jgi:hypothetical protein
MQLELGLKAQVRSAAPKSVMTAEKLIHSTGYRPKRKLLLIVHIELCRPERPAIEDCKEFGHSRSGNPPSLSAAAVAAVSRNADLL